MTLAQLHRHFATPAYTLVIHNGGVEQLRDFPNAFVFGLAPGPFVNLPADPALDDLSLIGADRFTVAVCARALERVTDPARVLREVHRILQPGGRLILSVATTLVEGDGARFTPQRLTALLQDWGEIEMMAVSPAPSRLRDVVRQLVPFRRGATVAREPRMLHAVATKARRGSA